MSPEQEPKLAKKIKSRQFNWQEFLGHWSREMLQSDLAEQASLQLTGPGWLGNPPANDAEITTLEIRLGLRLPPSYADFLKTSNGWGRLSFFIGRLRPATEVDWFRVENEQWVEVFGDAGSDEPDTEYFAYDEDGAALGHRAEHMHHLVQVSDVDDAVLLLNPRAVTPDGEWEAWFFANWVPGAVRHPSFAHLMSNQLRTFRNVQKATTAAWQPPTLPLPPPTLKRRSAKRIAPLKPTKPAVTTIEELMALVESADDGVRSRAIRQLSGKVGLRGQGRRRADLVEPLCRLFERSGDPLVRGLCISLLTEISPDGVAPPPLLAALYDPDPGVILSGIDALHYFPDPRSLAPLCRFVESRVNPLFSENAISALADLSDPAAVLTLIRVLNDTANRFEQSFGSAGVALGRIASPDAINALIAGLAHVDPRVRYGAVVGLDVSGDPRANSLLDQMKADVDDKVRTRAAYRTGRWPYGSK